MSTSVIKATAKSAGKTALIYLFASIFCAAFGAIYEIFSHGVYSAFMICAFVFPLVGGALPFLLLYTSEKARVKTRPTKTQMLKTVQGDVRYTWKAEKRKGSAQLYPGIAARSFYHAGIICLTVGSIMTGILDIYGTTNRLLVIYWFLGALLLFAAISIHLLSLLFNKRRRLYR